jgi:hypothetical protein
MRLNKRNFFRGAVAAISSAFMGVAIGDTAFSVDRDVETFYGYNMVADSDIFQAVSGQQYTEHALWRPFSSGEMLSQELFLNNPFAGFELEYRNSLLTKFTGIRYVSDIRVLPSEEVPAYIKRAAPFNP